MNLTFALEIIFTSFKRTQHYFSRQLAIGCLQWQSVSIGIYRLLPTAYCLLLILLLTSCLGTKYLQENQKLLYRQTIVAPRGFNKNGLDDLYAQKTNRKILGLPVSLLVWMHHQGEKNFNKQKFINRKAKVEEKFARKITKAHSLRKKDNLEFRKKKKLDGLDTKIENGNLFMQWGEPTAVYDSVKLKSTLEKMNNYLFIKGYFKGKATASLSETNRKVKILYIITPSTPYLIDTILYKIPDQNVFSLVKKSQSKSTIGKGDQYDQDKLTKERERIDLYLKDRGYYDFSRQYMDFQLDTASMKNHKVMLLMEIRNPSKADHHRQFKLDSVSFTTDAGVKGLGVGLKRTIMPYENITFNYFRPEFSKKVLASRVFITKDSLYNRSKTFSTQRQMANLDVFKFVNVNYDTSGGKFIANIFASPQDRYAWTNEAGVTVTQGFPGPYVSTNFKKRNFFGGLEIFELNGRFGFEGVASATETGNFYQSTEANGSVSLTFPQFLFPFSKAATFRYAKNNPRTRLLAGYTYTDRPEYQRAITTISAAYTWDINQKLQFSFTPTNLNIIRSTINDDFRKVLNRLDSAGNNLSKAFLPSFVGSMIFSVTWNNNYGSTQKKSSLIRGTLESGGTLLNLYTPQIIINQGLEPYQYIRFNLDFRRNRVINKTTSLAYRVNTGFGYAYSANKVLPYEKNFFAGGSNSVRAWRPRRLGVGSDPPPLNSNPTESGYYDYRFEKPGELLIEGSLEWRQKIFGFVNYGLFIDAGNVWALRSASNEAAHFSLDRFYQEFGIGTGFGLRFDFSFLILRLDVGMKAWDPGRPDGQRFVLGNARFIGPYGLNSEPVVYNIGIGYPF
jgi:outer membrane protein insertion porin family